MHDRQNPHKKPVNRAIVRTEYKSVRIHPGTYWEVEQLMQEVPNLPEYSRFRIMKSYALDELVKRGILAVRAELAKNKYGA